MGATHFLTMTLPKVATEMALNVLAYNMKRVINIMGADGLLDAMRAIMAKLRSKSARAEPLQKLLSSLLDAILASWARTGQKISVGGTVLAG